MRQTLADRFNSLAQLRAEKLERARECAALTLPSLLPPDGFAQSQQLMEPFSSVSGEGVTGMAARMLSAMLPLNDDPFFRFEAKSGDTYSLDTEIYLEQLAQQVNRALVSGNLRDQLFLALQHLIVTGDVLMLMDDDFTFSLKRMDQYVARRDVNGKLIEVIWVDFEPIDPDSTDAEAVEWTVSAYSPMDQKPEFTPCFCRAVYDHKKDCWKYTKEVDGDITDKGKYTVPPFTVLRWSGLVGEDYGRSHVEEHMGDIRSLEAYTQSLIEGMAASSRFFMAVSGSGTTDIDDLMTANNGDWIQARQEDVFVLSPSGTMRPATDAAFNAVNTMRQEVAKSFLMTAGQVRQAERVTATEVRLQAQELEQKLGGAFSAISRDLMQPILQRVMFVMTTNGMVDEGLAQAFSSDGKLTVSIVTGLQALSRDRDLERLMQMGQLLQQMPPEVAKTFKYTEYSKALVTALGFDANNWIISEDEQAQMQALEQGQQMMMQAAQTGMNAAAGQAGAAAAPDLANAMGTTPPPTN